jgi:glycerol-3-phosphate acyltransferase PlsY
LPETFLSYLYAAGLFLGAYLLGSIPFGLLLAKLAGYGDIRSIGSGNIGATNVLRTGNKWLALATLLLDGGKGAVASLIGMWLLREPDLALITGICAVLGHVYPVWLRFKGGKGVATAIGALLGAVPQLGAAVILTWLIVAFIFRFSSLAAITGFVALAPYAFFFGEDKVIIPCACLAALIVIKHRENIARIVQGKESKIGKKKS